MSNFKFKFLFIVLAVGFILIAFDVDVKTPLSYPNQYDNSDNVIGEFQYYNISSTYGAKCTYKLIDTSDVAKKSGTSQTKQNSLNQSGTKVIDKVFFDNFHIDIFNDFIGFILIFIACFGLKKSSRYFGLACLSAFCGMILHIIITLLPFITNGLLLCNIVMIMGTSYLAVSVLTTFLFTRGLFEMIPDVCCRDERKWGKITWFISFVLQILLTFIFWIGSDFKMLTKLGYIFEAFLVIDIIAFWLIMRRAYQYFENSYMNSLSKQR